jgi:putative redox protein
MQAKVNWKGRLSFEGTADSGFSIDLGAEPDVGGDGDGFRPLELMALSLAGCTAMDVISILSKKRQEVTDFEVNVAAERASEHPKVFTGAMIKYQVSGHGVDEKAVLRAIELSAQRYCPAQAMLNEVFPMELKYQIFEDNEGEKKLVGEGSYTPG